MDIHYYTRMSTLQMWGLLVLWKCPFKHKSIIEVEAFECWPFEFLQTLANHMGVMVRFMFCLINYKAEMV